MREPKRTTDGDDEIADQQRIRVSERDRGQRIGLDPQHGDVGLGVGANQLGIEPATIVEGDAIVSAARTT